MPQFELICFVLMLVAALDVVARKVRLPYPALMVLCGLGLGMVPGLPRVDFPPDLILPMFLPPLLFVERETLIELRNEHRINDEILRVVQRDVDLAEARLLEMKR